MAASDTYLDALTEPTLMLHATITRDLVLMPPGLPLIVRRINETIQILPSDMVRRTVEVQIDLRREAGTWGQSPERLAVPLAILSRRNQREIIVRSADGSRLPHLTRIEERTIAFEGCLDLLRYAINSEIVGQTDQKVGAVPGEMTADLWKYLAEDLAPDEVPAEIAYLAGARVPDNNDAWRTFRAATERFRGSWMLLIELPGAIVTQDRLTFSYEYDDIGFVDGLLGSADSALASSCRVIWPDDPPLQPVTSGWSRAGRRMRRIGRFFVGAPRVLRLAEAPAASSAASYHINITCPPDLNLIGAQLGVTKRELNGSESRAAFEVDKEAPLDRAHMTYRRGEDRVVRSIARVWVYAPVGGLVTTAVVAALFSTLLVYSSGLLLFGVNPLHWWSAARMPRELPPLDRSASATALVIVPSLVQVFTFRYGEGRLVALVFRRTRITLVFTTLPLAALAILVAFKVDSSHPGRWWLSSLLVVFLGLGLLVVQGERCRRAATAELQRTLPKPTASAAPQSTRPLAGQPPANLSAKADAAPNVEPGTGHGDGSAESVTGVDIFGQSAATAAPNAPAEDDEEAAVPHNTSETPLENRSGGNSPDESATVTPIERGDNVNE